LQLLAVDAERAVAGLDLTWEATEDRVVLEQVGHRGGVDEIVDRNKLEVRPGRLRRPEDVAPDPPKAVDSDLHSHCLKPSWSRCREMSRCYGPAYTGPPVGLSRIR